MENDKPVGNGMRPRIMLVPNTTSWILGTWAKEILKWNSDRYEIVIYPFGEMRADPKKFADILNEIDVVHCLSQTIFPTVRKLVAESQAQHVTLISSIHHIVRFEQIEDNLHADKIMVVCRQFQEQLIARQVPEHKLHLIYNGVDMQRFQPWDRQQARSQFDIPPDAFTIGFSANASSDHDGRKGVDVLKAVLSELAAQRQDLHVIMTGPGWGEAVAAYERSNVRIHYFPYLPLERMPVYYSALDVYLVTARVEGGPVPPLEAMSCGAAVITTPVGTMRDYIQDGVNGWIVPVDDAPAITRRVQQVAADPELRQRVAAAGRQTIHDCLQWKDTVGRMDTLYGTAVSRPRLSKHEQRYPDFAKLNPELIRKDEKRWQAKFVPDESAAGRLKALLGRGSPQPARHGPARTPGGNGARDYRLKYDAVSWLNAMTSGEAGVGRCRFTPSAGDNTFLSSTYAVFALNLFGQLDALTDQQRREWGAYIRSHQSPHSGLFLEPLLKPEELPESGHNWEYVTWEITNFALGALDVLGQEPDAPLTFLEDFLRANELNAWLDGLNWGNPWLESNRVMYILTFLFRQWERSGEARYKDAIDAILDWLDRSQSPVTGFWGNNQERDLYNAMAGAFHFYFFYFYLGRPVNYMRQIIDHTLQIQTEDGLYDPRGGGGACLDLDAIDILIKFSYLTDYRLADIHASLRRSFEAILANQNPDGGFCECKRPPKVVRRRGTRLLRRLGLGWLARPRLVPPPPETKRQIKWERMRYRVDESNLWATWFRPLALGLISARYPGEFIDSVDWRFGEGPFIGWHDEEKLLALRQSLEAREESRV